MALTMKGIKQRQTRLDHLGRDFNLFCGRASGLRRGGFRKAGT
jgi:hypothetical protein